MIRCAHMGITYTNSNTNSTAITTMNVKSPRKSVENDYNRIVHGWLKAMKDLSPPRMRIKNQETGPLDKSDSDAAEIEYRTWMVSYFSVCFVVYCL
mgnify:CR=1 FL=1